MFFNPNQTVRETLGTIGNGFGSIQTLFSSMLSPIGASQKI
jgi:hypothetical protein